MRLRFLLLTLILLGGGWWSWQQFGENALRGQPIRYVRIEGAFQYTSKDRLKQVLAPQMKLGYYHADMQAIHQAIKALPLVDKVDVKRVWPDAVHIKITEQKPVVRWGNSALLNKQGDLLVPDSIEEFKNLPLITGPAGQEKKLLEIMKGVYIVLKDKSMQLAEFHVNERRAWRIKLANGMEMQLGRKAPLENMQRFLKTMDLLGEEQIAMIASVDTRYPNGFAVTWKPEVTTIDWKAIAEKNKNLI
ncbi:cell division protein FtsQ/DivIB [Methylomonas sp. DH-1]|uniref:cell division protein FtsQ/DivIB n=1 Tax=Methylomonas sp. (strain DH-1) TaxID=1727196 RepID=UPI0007C96E2E|nr:cell division protein FtsQ/DivIB [Methylomonas sp. DH-1]ANE57230.1 cell division protein FtsQ [Methylomonas sp. DH-1]